MGRRKVCEVMTASVCQARNCAHRLTSMTRILLWLQKLWVQVLELFCSALGKQPWCSTVHMKSYLLERGSSVSVRLSCYSQWRGTLKHMFCNAFFFFFFCSWATFDSLLLGLIFYKCSKNKAFLGYLPKPPWCRTLIKTGFCLSGTDWCRSTKGYIATG